MAGSRGIFLGVYVTVANTVVPAMTAGFATLSGVLGGELRYVSGSLSPNRCKFPTRGERRVSAPLEGRGTYPALVASTGVIPGARWGTAPML